MYLGALFGSQLFALVVAGIALEYFPPFRYWIDTPLGQCFLVAMGGLAALLVVLLLTRAQSGTDLLNLIEIKSIREGVSYFVVVVGVFLGIIGVFISQAERVEFSEKSHIVRVFIHQEGLGKNLFAILLLVGPIFEEIIMRGFLYRAFRKRYGVSFSIFIIVLAGTFTHLNAVTLSVWVLLLLTALQIILCLILEKTGNLWNCIMCHFAYNATLACAWLMG
jgi:membrane protease YdiL (CAAX protease family)